MNNVFNSTDLANRLSDLHNSNIQDCDKNSLKNLEDLKSTEIAEILSGILDEGFPDKCVFGFDIGRIASGV